MHELADADERAALPRESHALEAIEIHSHKYIAYELGVTVSSVVRRLKSAMLKLGVATRHDLLRKLGR